MSTSHRIVVAGAGLAGMCAAERFRERGYTGELVIVGDEPHPPYNRTPLSKGLVAGEMKSADLRLRAAVGLDAIWRLGHPLSGLDVDNHRLSLANGETLEYDGLVIATGVAARHLPGAPSHLPHVTTVRTLDDAGALDRALARTQHLAIVGGGFIGCEIASTARARGLDVTIVDINPTLLHTALGPALGAIVGDLHRDNGVRLHLGVGVDSWTETRSGVQLHLDDGETVIAEAAVVGIGTTPNTGWLTGTDLDLTDGIGCTATCHVRDAAGNSLDAVVAAGDVARWPNHLFDHTPRRAEHWINAIEMGRAAADALLAGPQAAPPFTPVPRFWSHQHRTRIQSAGIPSLGTDMTIVEGNPAQRRFVAGFTRVGSGGPVLTAVVGFDSPRAVARHSNSIGHIV